MKTIDEGRLRFAFPDNTLASKLEGSFKQSEFAADISQVASGTATSAMLFEVIGI